MVFQDLLEGGRNASQRLLGLRGSYGFRHVCGITGRLGQRQPSPYEFPLAAVGYSGGSGSFSSAMYSIAPSISRLGSRSPPCVLAIIHLAKSKRAGSALALSASG